MLVQGRSVSGADDIAALLHGRVTKWVKSSGDRMQADRIVGLFPAAVGVTDQDVVQGLRERRELIERRARSLTMTALEDRQPWALRFGRPPADADGREDWLRRLDTIAAYRDRWQVSGNAFFGTEPAFTRTDGSASGRAACGLGCVGRYTDRQLVGKRPRGDQRPRTRIQLAHLAGPIRPSLWGDGHPLSCDRYWLGLIP